MPLNPASSPLACRSILPRNLSQESRSSSGYFTTDCCTILVRLSLYRSGNIFLGYPSPQVNHSPMYSTYIHYNYQIANICIVAWPAKSLFHILHPLHLSISHLLHMYEIYMSHDVCVIALPGFLFYAFPVQDGRTASGPRKIALQGGVFDSNPRQYFF